MPTNTTAIVCPVAFSALMAVAASAAPVGPAALVGPTGSVIPVGQIGLGGVQHWNAGEADKLLCAVVHVEITRYRLV